MNSTSYILIVICPINNAYVFLFTLVRSFRDNKTIVYIYNNSTLSGEENKVVICL